MSHLINNEKFRLSGLARWGNGGKGGDRRGKKGKGRSRLWREGTQWGDTQLSFKGGASSLEPGGGGIRFQGN